MESLPYDTVDDGPGKDEVSKEVPLHVSNLFDSRAHVEHLVAITSEISAAAIMFWLELPDPDFCFNVNVNFALGKEISSPQYNHPAMLILSI